MNSVNKYFGKILDRKTSSSKKARFDAMWQEKESTVNLGEEEIKIEIKNPVRPPRQLTEDQIQECRDAFAIFDKHRRGKIRLKDLGTLMRNLGENPTEVELEDIIIESNLDGSGMVDFPRFISIMTRRCENSDDATRLAFGAFDMNGDGLISVEELKRYFLKVGQPCSEEEIEDLMKEVDIDGDGYMNYDEFLEMVNMN